MRAEVKGQTNLCLPWAEADSINVCANIKLENARIFGA